MRKPRRGNIQRLKGGKRPAAVNPKLRPRNPLAKLLRFSKAGPHLRTQKTVRQAERRRLREECAQLDEAE